MAELADAPDLGSGTSVCRFDPCYPHQSKKTHRKMGLLLLIQVLWGEPCKVAGFAEVLRTKNKYVSSLSRKT